jgi:hypothetical protein
MNNWIGDILRRNCILKYAIEGKINEGKDMTGSRGKGSQQLINSFKEKRG